MPSTFLIYVIIYLFLGIVFSILTSYYNFKKGNNPVPFYVFIAYILLWPLVIILVTSITIVLIILFVRNKNKNINESRHL